MYMGKLTKHDQQKWMDSIPNIKDKYYKGNRRKQKERKK